MGRKKLGKLCTKEGCGRPHVAKGMCGTHYGMWRRMLPKNHRRDREQRRARRYGLTLDRVEEMWVACGGRCQACGEPMVRRGRGIEAMNVDHSEATGEVRGLLHGRCNRALVLLKESRSHIEGLLRYAENI